MNKEKLLEMFKENLVEWEFKEKEKLVQAAIEKYTFLEKKQIEDWMEEVKLLSILVKKNAPFSTIIDLSGIILPSNVGGESIVYTTSIVLNRNYLKNAFNNVGEIKRYTAAFLGAEKVLIIRVIRNRRKAPEMFKLERDTHSYLLMEYKDFFNMNMLNRLVSIKNDGTKIFLIVEGIGLPLLKIIFKTFGIVISSGKNNLKGSLSPTQFNLSKLMLSIFNTSAYKIITQSFYASDKFVNKSVMDLTERNLELFIKTIIIDENNLFCFIHSSLSKYKKMKSETNLLLMEKDIEKVNKYIKENPSKFVEVHKNVNTFNSVNNVSKRGIHTSTNSVENSNNKVLINSKYNNLVFDNQNQSILFIYIDDTLGEVIKNLSNGCYTLNFYPYIQNFDLNDSFILKENNEELVLCKDNSNGDGLQVGCPSPQTSYKSWVSLIMKKDIGEKYSSDKCLTSETFGIVSDRLQYLMNEAIDRVSIDDDKSILLVISKVNESQFNKYDYKKGLKYVYDLSCYSFLDKDGTISIYNPITTGNEKVDSTNMPNSIKEVRVKDNSKLSCFNKKSGNKRFYSISLFGNNRRYSTSTPESKVNTLNSLGNNNAYIFTNIEKILDNNPINEKTQIEIENFLHNQGKHIIEDTNVLGINVNYLNNNIKKYCFDKGELIKEYLQKFLKNKDMEYYIDSKSITKKYAYYTFKIVKAVKVNEVSNVMLYIFLKIVTFHNINSDKELHNGSTSNNIFLGKLLVNKYIKSIKGKDVSYSNYKKDFLSENETNKLIFNDDFYLHLGSKLTEIMIECGLFNLSSVMYKEHNHSVFKVSEQVKGIIPVNSVILAPLNLPMIVEPKSYDKDTLGGYLLNDMDYDDKLITKKIGVKEYSTISDDNIVYSSVNNMMKTAFKINKNLLDYLIYYNHEHNLLTMEGDNIYKDISENSLDGREKKSYQKYLSNKLLYDYVIRIAITYKNVPEIFFPMRMDYRGRLYPISAYLHYQSCELAKALLLFSRPDIIKRSDSISIDYLKAYGATCFGNTLDKKSYAKRLEWVNNNWDDIINYRNLILLNEAENKFLFLSFCMEIERFNNFLSDDSTLEFKTYIPIQLDGTCNGYQHLALLSNEVGLYDKLNLDGRSTNKDPSDFYTHIINQLNIHLDKKSKLTKNKEEKESYKRLINLGISRSNIKQAVMTKPYNAKDYTITEYIINTLVLAMKEEYIKNGVTKFKIWYKVNENMVNYKDIYLLTRCLDEIIFHDYPRIKALLFYLKSISSIMYKLNLPIVWKLPTGLEVNQQYMVTRKKSTRPYTYLDNVLILKITDNIKMDKIKQETALMPNLVHSLDAASLTLLYHAFRKSIGSGVVNFYGVHDCYGVSAKYIDTLISQLRGIYIDLYSKEGYIKQFDTDIIDYICSIYSLDRDSAFDVEERTLTMKGEIIKLPPIPNIINTTTLTKAYESLSKAKMFIK